jgi:hypothetical protein
MTRHLYSSSGVYLFAGVIFLRIYLNRQTALANKIVIDTVNNIVMIDMGSAIQWRHLHVNSLNDTPNDMVLLWTADQHGGQANGMFSSQPHPFHP